MIEINLLPAGEKRRPARGAGARRPIRVPAFAGDPYQAGVGVLALLLLLGMGFAYWRVDTRTADVRTEIDREAADSLQLASTIQLVEQLRARQDTIEQKIDVIRSVDERRYVWPHILDEISRSMPPYTWLTRLAATEEAAPAPAPGDTATAPAAEPAGPAFNLEGSAGSTQALTQFMKSLESSPFLRDVTLVTSEQAVTNGRSYQKFTLEARYETPDSSFIETVPVITVD